MRNTTVIAAITFLLGTGGPVLAGPSAEAKCQAAQSQVVGKLAACIAKADRGFVLAGDATAYTEAVTKCTDKHFVSWVKLMETATKAGTECYSEPSPFDVQEDVLAFTACVAEKASGVSNGHCFRALSATGQTSDVYGPGSDGDLEPGATMEFIDNGDGTITAANTGLMWEKKDDSGGIHDMDNLYSWSSPGYGTLNGTVVTGFLNTLNDTSGGGSNCFAGHCDWRLPTVRELLSIVDYSKQPTGLLAMVTDEFHRSATCSGCSSIVSESCSCTAIGGYTTSTSAFPAYVWQVDSGSGQANPGQPIDFSRRARAVRGGL